MAKIVQKDPNAVLDYVFDWSGWLPEGDQILTATVTAPTGLVVDSVITTTTKVTAWLSGGTAGSRYDVVCHITTADLRTEDRTLRVEVRQR